MTDPGLTGARPSPAAAGAVATSAVGGTAASTRAAAGAFGGLAATNAPAGGAMFGDALTGAAGTQDVPWSRPPEPVFRDPAAAVPLRARAASAPAPAAQDRAATALSAGGVGGAAVAARPTGTAVAGPATAADASQWPPGARPGQLPAPVRLPAAQRPSRIAPPPPPLAGTEELSVLQALDGVVSWLERKSAHGPAQQRAAKVRANQPVSYQAVSYQPVSYQPVSSPGGWPRQAGGLPTRPSAPADMVSFVLPPTPGTAARRSARAASRSVRSGRPDRRGAGQIERPVADNPDKRVSKVSRRYGCGCLTAIGLGLWVLWPLLDPVVRFVSWVISQLNR